MKGHAFTQRLGYAMAGLRAAWRMEKSLRIHVAATALVVSLLMLTRAPALWWALIALTIGAVMASELLNTALEALADHLHPQQHPAIGLSKDIAAGAVLLSSLAALVVGAAFFVDEVWPLIQEVSGLFA